MMNFPKMRHGLRRPQIGALLSVLALAACDTKDAHDTGDAATNLQGDAGDAGDAGCVKGPWFASGPDDEPFSATLVSRNSLCQHMECPSNIRSLLLQMQATALELDGGRCGVRAVSGCGVDSLYQDFPMPRLSWHYSSDTGELVGVSRYDDVASFSIGECTDAVYQAGQGAPPCLTATTRSLCNDEDGGV